MLHLHKTHHQKGLLLSLTKNRLTLFIATALFAVTSFYIHSLALAEHHDVFNLNAMTFQSRSDRHESMGSEGSPYAYVFMAFHCFPEREGQSTYRAYIANILASAKLLRKHGSKADIVAFFMMHIDSNSMQLPAEEEEMLYLMGVQIRYLPKATDWQGSTSWKVSTLNKVHLLNMTEYRRVLFLDGDAMPSTNLDYMFYLSEGEDAILKETVIISTRRSPMWAGFFLTTPNSTAYKILLEEIRHVAVKKFDKYWGWGATTIIEPDYWASNDPKIRGQNWTWFGANIDQGMFYYYAKYMQKSMTQILNDKIIHYGPGPNRTLQIESEISVKNANDSPLFKHRETNYSFKSGACSKEWGAGSCVPPYSDHLHFAGHRSKPWMTPPPFDLWNRTDQGWKASNHFWWRTVFGLQEENGINITYLKLV